MLRSLDPGASEFFDDFHLDAPPAMPGLISLGEHLEPETMLLAGALLVTATGLGAFAWASLFWRLAKM